MITHKRLFSLHSSLGSRYSRVVLLACFMPVSLLFLVFRYSDLTTNASFLPHSKSATSDISAFASSDLKQNGSFRPLQVEGFDNNGLLGGHEGRDFSCQSLAHSATVGVEDSFFLNDNLWQIASSLDSHPLVQYPLAKFVTKKNTTSLTEVISKSWDRLATACALLPKYSIYLCVSRIIFHPALAKDRGLINFLRGRIFSEDWVHQEGYELKWKDQPELVFPLNFDTSTEYMFESNVWGPEDARILVEDNEESEPVIVFNMKSKSLKKRAMWIFRPFTQRTTILTIQGVDRPKAEKNWVPFFVKDIGSASTEQKEPSKSIHFVQRFKPLTILKCELETGMCEVVFEQKFLDDRFDNHEVQNASLRGGTQFVPVPASIPSHWWSSGSQQLQAFVSFPRHHVDYAADCKKPSYRPEIAVLVTNTTHFYMTYVSEPLDFGANTVMSEDMLADTCGKGRIMIANSISRWDLDAMSPDDHGKQTDIMTLTLSVDDATAQVMRIAGLYELIRGLPSMKSYFESGSRYYKLGGSPNLEGSKDIFRQGEMDAFDRASAISGAMRACVEEAALLYHDVHNDRLQKY